NSLSLEPIIHHAQVVGFEIGTIPASVLQSEVMPKFMHQGAGLLLHGPDIGIRQTVSVQIPTADIPASQGDLKVISAKLSTARTRRGADLLMGEESIMEGEPPGIGRPKVGWISL